MLSFILKSFVSSDRNFLRRRSKGRVTIFFRFAATKG